MILMQGFTIMDSVMSWPLVDHISGLEWEHLQKWLSGQGHVCRLPGEMVE